MRWGDWSGGSEVLTTFLSWFGDTWQKGTLLLLENWGWVCICAKWAGFTLSHICVEFLFFPYFIFRFIFLLKTAILRIEEASAWQLWQLCCLLPLRCCLHTVVQVTPKDNQVLQSVNWKSSDWSACSLCIFALLEYRQWSDRGEVDRSVQKYVHLSAHSCRLRFLMFANCSSSLLVSPWSWNWKGNYHCQCDKWPHA